MPAGGNSREGAPDRVMEERGRWELSRCGGQRKVHGNHVGLDLGALKTLQKTNGDRVRIWIVDDENLFRFTLKRLIDRQGAWICDADFSNAESLLERLESGDAPELILLDIGLPGANGDAALPRILELAPAVAVIVLSAQSEREVVFRAIRGGAAGYLLKGCGEDEIRQRILEVLDGGAALSPKIGRLMMERMRDKPSAATEVDYGLTPRELEVLEWLVQGLPKKQIAVRVGMSPHTVDSHLRSIYRRMNVRSNTEAVARAVREGVV